MAKTIFGTSEKSNFILNMDLDWYRRMCGRLLIIILWATALSSGLNHITYYLNGDIADMIREGGFKIVVGLLALTLRTVATIFSIGGVAALIWTVCGMMRNQFTKTTRLPYLLIAGSLLWAVISMFRAYDLNTALFGQDGRDEGWIALLMYAGMFWLGSMLRRQENIERFLRQLMYFGIGQCLFGLFQALPFIDYADINKALNPYRNIDPLLYWNLRLPCGMTDSPITFAMLLGVILGIAVPAALLGTEKKTRITAAVCAGMSMLMVFKTQTIAGLIAGIGAVVLAVVIMIVKRKSLTGAKIAIPVMAGAAVLALVWVWFTPAINHAFYRPDMNETILEERLAELQAIEDGTVTADELSRKIELLAREPEVGDAQLENGFRLYDGGIVWDDSFYRLTTSGSYQKDESLFDIYNAGSVLRYCMSEGWRVVKIDPLFGVGSDNFGYTQMKTSYILAENTNSVDRPYNDFLFIAGTRGIPSLLAHIALLVICLRLAWKHRKDIQGWGLLAAGAGVILYTLTSMVGISVLTVTPLLWILLGVLAGEPITEPQKNK